MIVAAGQAWLELGAAAADVEQAGGLVRTALADRSIEGVVLVGGLDVVPAEQLNVLDDALRRRVEQQLGRNRGDSDGFIVWNDDLYGDRDGDRLPELPVSRLPDGRSGANLIRQLSSSGPARRLTYGVRNLDRPFAESVFQMASGGTGRLFVSDPTTPGSLGDGALATSSYLMLHGRDTDSTRYWGEDEEGDTVEAVDLSNVGATLSGGIVFLGCCWGALTALPRASKFSRGENLVQKTPADSLAMSFLDRGALAVIGCTGTHYSPDVEPYTFFGQPMHVSFWKHIHAGLPPARALFEAKREYAANLPHGQFDDISRAVEVKICRQFTCLGLGW